MTKPISTYAELEKAIAALPPIPPGNVRVFRGQTRDYPSIVPSGLRGSLRKRVIWDVYSQHLHTELVFEAANEPGGLSLATLQAIGLWLKAIAQHYGPGSDFVDVTYSVEVALWFALHEFEESTAIGVTGPSGSPDPLRDHPTYGSLCRHLPWHESGYLYAFDLPKWDGEGIAAAAVVVDLADAPPVFSSSARIRAQHGCLVNCRQDDASPLDLRTHLVPGTPIVVARPMTGATMLGRTTAQMFPSPEVDEWYARFLSVPMTYAPQPHPPSLQRPIPVTVYRDDNDSRYTEEVLYRDVSIDYPLLHRSIQGFGQSHLGTAAEPAASAIAVVLEAPMVFPYAPGDSDLWNHGLLASDLPDRCPYYEFGSDAPAGEVALDNVLFEFSALERTGWERVVKDGAVLRVLRALWLRRRGDIFQAGFIYQDIPGGAPELDGFLPLRFDEKARRWVLFHPGGKAPDVPITEDPALAKGIIIALMLLRHLSPALKLEATPRLMTGREGERKVLLNFARDAARLFRVQSPSCNWYVLRDASSPEEPFTHSRNPAGVITIMTNVSFREVSAESLRRDFQKQYAESAK